MSTDELRTIVVEPTITANAVLLLGYVAGLISLQDDYEFVDADPTHSTQTIRHLRSGNAFRLSVLQIGGVE